MSETKVTSFPKGLQNPENKNNELAQKYEGQVLPQEFNQKDANGQKKQEDNDFTCQFKLVVRQRFKQTLKYDPTQQLFTIIVNQVVEERVKRNFVATSEQINQPAELKITIQPQQKIEQHQLIEKGPSQIDKLKAQDEQVRKKIQELMKKRPPKKTLTSLELDPNRDKGFILAKKMNEVKQQRQQKYLQIKKQLQEQRSELSDNQLSTKSCIENISILSLQKGNRKYRKKSDDLQLPKINLHKNSFQTNINGPRSSRTGSNTQRQISEDKISLKMSTIGDEKGALSARSRYLPKRQKRRNIPREIEVLKKSQIITQKYYNRRMTIEILTDIIFNAVKVVEKKKQFFHNAPPKPVYQMLKISHQNNLKSSRISSYKSDIFRINVNIKERKKTDDKKMQTLNDAFQNKEFGQKQCRVNRTQYYEMVKNNQKQEKNQHEQAEDSEQDIYGVSNLQNGRRRELPGTKKKVRFDISLRNRANKQRQQPQLDQSFQNSEQKSRTISFQKDMQIQSYEQQNQDDQNQITKSQDADLLQQDQDD